MRSAVENQGASKSHLALLEDRILMRQNKPQRFGSQVDALANVDLFPVDDEENLDNCRAEVLW